MISIKYSFFEYYQQNFIAPMTWVIFCTIIFIAEIVHIIKQLHYTNDNFISYMIKNPKDFFCLIVILLLIPLRGIILANSGIHLLYEKADDWIIVTGEIENVYQLSQIEGGIYTDDSHRTHIWGERIIVNGTKYYLQYGELNVGDHITMKVLPKSKLVLELTVTGRQDDGS